MKIELAPNWRVLHRSWSVRAAAVLAMLMSAKQAMLQITSSDLVQLFAPLRELVTNPYYDHLMLFLTAAIAVLRFINQGLSVVAPADDAPAEPTP